MAKRWRGAARWLGALGALAAVSGWARASEPAAEYGGDPRPWRLSVGGAGAWTVSSLFGGVTDPGRGSLQLSVHAHVPLVSGSRIALDYSGGVVPVELAGGTRVLPAAIPSSAATLSPTPVPRTVYGVGIDGLGLTARFVTLGRWEPYLTALGGVRIFGAPVPNPRGTRFDFSADLGGGVALRLPRGRRAKVGFALHHLSNGGLGQANPSLNAFALTVGLEGLVRGGRGHR